MKSKSIPGGSIAAAGTLFAVVVSALGSGAAAQALMPEPAKPEPLQIISQPVVQPLPDEAQPQVDVADVAQDDAVVSLAQLVAAKGQAEALSPEMRCLAGAIYFEAKSESLPGQLAVGRVIVNRTKSGRFPASYCGVVYQPSQFSFVHGHSMPTINTGSQDWREAVAIAQIADAGSWRSPAEGALFFHASHVAPRWRLTRIARVDNHVFYR